MATSSRTWPGKKSRARCRPCRRSRSTSGRCPSGRLGPPWRPWRRRGRAWPVKRCLRFLILTAARAGEVRGATWAEVDFEAKEWRIPGERMKRGCRSPMGASRPAVRRGVGCAGARPRRGGWERAHLPVAAEAGPAPLPDDPDEDSARPRTRGAGDRSRLPQLVSGLVRGDREAAGSRGGCACPHGWGSRRRIFPLGSVCASARLMDQWASFLTGAVLAATRPPNRLD